VAGGFLVRVSVGAQVYGPCARCLREVMVKVQTSEEEFVPTSPEGWDETELSTFVDGLVVDIAGIAREAVVLALPTQVLCSTECRGLCPQCGKDLNLGPCDCLPQEVDERWAKLREIRW
ncbi:MAG: DUF177 domain-containing protein, partial [Thermoleophilia bacterium]|nr:DUF177 domain-containing protein [Thermoleophilia bacterium]